MSNYLFSYYGGKSKVVDAYPSPKHKRLIEPFAGGAVYSLKYHWHDVLLVDKYERLVNVWRWLINEATPNDILSLPRLKQGESIPEDLPQPAKDFLGWLVVRGVPQPGKNVSSFVGDITPKLIDASRKVKLIKHWEVRLGSYEDIENEEATWFVDPPYQFGGEHYVESNKNIDFSQLAEWCKSRNGQVIVCENSKANWLPFYPMRQLDGMNHRTTEVIWSNEKHDYQAVQMDLFTNLVKQEHRDKTIGELGF